jgi:SAM-dependent methyltransferase
VQRGEFRFRPFFFNGIDYVSHNGRPAVLSEINRVLKPGGWFFFSSHNRAATYAAKREGLRELLKRLLFLRRHLRLRRLESQTPEYAILNDSGLSLFAAHILRRSRNAGGATSESVLRIR